MPLLLVFFMFLVLLFFLVFLVLLAVFAESNNRDATGQYACTNERTCHRVVDYLLPTKGIPELVRTVCAAQRASYSSKGSSPGGVGEHGSGSTAHQRGS